MRTFARILTVALASAWLMMLAGCSSEPSLKDFNNNNIKKLRGAYGLYLVNHQLQGPKSEDELKSYLKTDKGAVAKMKLMGLEPADIDGIFVSERDGKPFKVRYGLSGLGDHPIVFEAEGIDGKRFVAYSTPRELAADEYEKSWSAKIAADSGMDAMNAAAGPVEEE